MALVDRRAKLAAQARAHRRWEDELLDSAEPGAVQEADSPPGSDYPLHHLTVSATPEQLRRLEELTREELVAAGFDENGTSAIVASAAAPPRTTTAERMARYRASREEARRAGLARFDTPATAVEQATPARPAAFAANLDGGMIALLPDDPAALAVDGGDDPELLHVTLRYVTPDASGLDDDTRTAIHRAAAKAAEERSEPLMLKIVGCGTLGGDDPQATVLFVQAADASDGVDLLNETIEAELTEFGEEHFPARHDAFIPHLTVGYGIDIAEVQSLVGTEIKFSSGVTVVLGGEHTPHPWGGASDADASTADGEEFTVNPGPALERFAEGEGEVPEVPEAFEVDGAHWRGVLIVEGHDSGDGRFIEPGALGHRDLPLPLMAMFRNPDGGMGHDAAELVGRIDRIWRDGDNIMGEGSFDEGSDLGREALRLVREGFMRGVSADLDRVEVEFENEMDDDVGFEEMFDFDPGRMLVVEGRVMGACHDDTTEILAEDSGWVRFADLPRGERVATMNPKTREFEWQEPTGYTADPWDGRMIRFTGGGDTFRSLDMLVTPNHRMLVQSTSTGRLSFMPAEELVTKSPRSYVIPQVSEWTVPDVERVHLTPVREMAAQARPLDFDGDAFAAFMGAYLADGSTTETGVRLSARPSNKMRDRYAKAMRDLFDNPFEHESGFGASHTALAEWLQRLGTAREKFIPAEVRNLSARQLRLFLDHFGDRDDRRLYTSSEAMAGDLVEVAQKAGLWAWVAERPAVDGEIDGRTVKANGPRYVVTLRNRPDSRPAKTTSWSAEWVDGHVGTVYCVTVPNESIYTRRNGIPAWGGNTLTSFPAFEEAYIEIVAGDTEPSEAIVAAGGRVPKAAQVRTYVPLQVIDTTALVASSGKVAPDRPPAEWFEMPKLDGPTPVRVTDDGQVFGHVATFGSCHIGFGNRCVTVPRAAQGYGNFTTGETVCADGSRVATGPLVVDTVHPDLKLQASDAAAFYAHTGAVAADVAVYEDRWGIVIAGSARPTATEAHLRAVRGGDVSPDWRTMDGRLEMVALLAVNNSGFKVRPKGALAASAGVEAAPRATVRLDIESGAVLALTTRGVDLAAQVTEEVAPDPGLVARIASLERREAARVNLARLQARVKGEG